eukprot:5157589-Amphidinium_carterae.1
MINNDNHPNGHNVILSYCTQSEYNLLHPCKSLGLGRGREAPSTSSLVNRDAALRALRAAQHAQS